MQINNQQTFQVQRILDKKIFNGKTLYLVKWKGFSIQESTWECNKLLMKHKDKIVQFRRHHKNIQSYPTIKMEEDFNQNNITDNVKRKRGRPPKLTSKLLGNLDIQKKNRKNTQTVQIGQFKVKRRRGRPPGSKNKSSKILNQIQHDEQQELDVFLQTQEEYSYQLQDQIEEKKSKKILNKEKLKQKSQIRQNQKSKMCVPSQQSDSQNYSTGSISNKQDIKTTESDFRSNIELEKEKIDKIIINTDNREINGKASRQIEQKTTSLEKLSIVKDKKTSSQNPSQKNKQLNENKEGKDTANQIKCAPRQTNIIQNHKFKQNIIQKTKELNTKRNIQKSQNPQNVSYESSTCYLSPFKSQKITKIHLIESKTYDLTQSIKNIIIDKISYRQNQKLQQKDLQKIQSDKTFQNQFNLKQIDQVISILKIKAILSCILPQNKQKTLIEYTYNPSPKFDLIYQITREALDFSQKLQKIWKSMNFNLKQYIKKYPQDQYMTEKFYFVQFQQGKYIKKMGSSQLKLYLIIQFFKLVPNPQYFSLLRTIINNFSSYISLMEETNQQKLVQKKKMARNQTSQTGLKFQHNQISQFQKKCIKQLIKQTYIDLISKDLMRENIMKPQNIQAKQNQNRQHDKNLKEKVSLLKQQNSEQNYEK